jgi:hypothetical protein
MLSWSLIGGDMFNSDVVIVLNWRRYVQLRYCRGLYLAEICSTQILSWSLIGGDMFNSDTFMVFNWPRHFKLQHTITHYCLLIERWVACTFVSRVVYIVNTECICCGMDIYVNGKETLALPTN